MYRPYKMFAALDDLRWDSASYNFLSQNHVSNEPSASSDNDETKDYENALLFENRVFRMDVYLYLNSYANMPFYVPLNFNNDQNFNLPLHCDCSHFYSVTFALQPHYPWFWF